LISDREEITGENVIDKRIKRTGIIKENKTELDFQATIAEKQDGV
jgi:hypothetical protein